MTHSYAWQDLFLRHDSFICVTWLIYAIWLLHMCDTSHSHDTTHSHVWHESYEWKCSVKWLSRTCDMTQTYAWHESLMCAPLHEFLALLHSTLYINIRSRNLVSVCISHTESMRSLYSINLRAYMRTCAHPPPSTISSHKRHRRAISFSSVCFLSLCLSRMHARAIYVHTTICVHMTHRLAAWAFVSIQAPCQVRVCVCVYVFVCVCVCVRECV